MKMEYQADLLTQLHRMFRRKRQDYVYGKGENSST